jgi:hypothetical protein
MLIVCLCETTDYNMQRRANVWPRVQSGNFKMLSHRFVIRQGKILPITDHEGPEGE